MQYTFVFFQQHRQQHDFDGRNVRGVRARGDVNARGAKQIVKCVLVLLAERAAKFAERVLFVLNQLCKRWQCASHNVLPLFRKFMSLWFAAPEIKFALTRHFLFRDGRRFPPHIRVLLRVSDKGFAPGLFGRRQRDENGQTVKRNLFQVVQGRQHKALCLVLANVPVIKHVQQSDDVQRIELRRVQWRNAVYELVARKRALQDNAR